MDKQLTLDELKEMHGKPVWCRIPSDNPRWGIVDAESSCVVLGAHHRLMFYYYGEWKAFTSPDPIPSPTIKPGDKKEKFFKGYNPQFYFRTEENNKTDKELSRIWTKVLLKRATASKEDKEDE